MRRCIYEQDREMENKEVDAFMNKTEKWKIKEVEKGMLRNKTGKIKREIYEVQKEDGC